MKINETLSKNKRSIFLLMGARISRRTLVAPVGSFANKVRNQPLKREPDRANRWFLCRLLDRPQTGCIHIYKDVWTVNTRRAFVLVFAGLLYKATPASAAQRAAGFPWRRRPSARSSKP